MFHSGMCSSPFVVLLSLLGTRYVLFAIADGLQDPPPVFRQGTDSSDLGRNNRSPSRASLGYAESSVRTSGTGAPMTVRRLATLPSKNSPTPSIVGSSKLSNLVLGWSITKCTVPFAAW